MPRTQTRGRGAEAITEGAWASSLSMSASSQQQVPLSTAAADPQHAAHEPSQPDSLTGSQALTGTPAQIGPTAGPEHSSQGLGLSRLQPMHASCMASKHDGSMGVPRPGSSIQQGPVPGMPALSASDLAPCGQKQPDEGVASLASRAAAARQAHAPSGRAHQNRGLQGSMQQRGISANTGAPASAAQHIMSRPQARSVAKSTQAGSRHSSQGQQQSDRSVASRQTQGMNLDHISKSRMLIMRLSLPLTTVQRCHHCCKVQLRGLIRDVAAPADSATSASQLHTPTAPQELASGPCSTSTLTPNSTSISPAQRQTGRADPGSMGRPPSRDRGRPAELAESHGHRLEASGYASGQGMAGPERPVRVHGQSHCPSDLAHLGLAHPAMQSLPSYARDVQRPAFSPHGQPALHGQQCQQNAGMPVQGQWPHRSSIMQQEQHLHSSGLPQPQWQPSHRPVLQHMSNLGPVRPNSNSRQHGSRTAQQGSGRPLDQQLPQQALQQHMHVQSPAQHSSSAPQQPSSGNMPACQATHPQQLPTQPPLQIVRAGDSVWRGSSSPATGGQQETPTSSKVQLQHHINDQQARPQPLAQHVGSISVGDPMGSAPQSLRVAGPSDQPQPGSAAAAGPRRQQHPFPGERPAALQHHGHASAQQGAASLQHRSSDAATGPQRPAISNLGPQGWHGAQQQSSLPKQSSRLHAASPAASGPMTGPSEPSSSTGKPLEAARGPAGRRQGAGEAEIATNPGHEVARCKRGPFKGALLADVLRAWVTRDLAAHAAHLRRTSEASPTCLQNPSRPLLAVR